MIKRMTMMILAAVIVSFAVVSLGSATEVITIKNANGGNYNVTAWNTTAQAYYFINGRLNSDSHQIRVPKGYASTITVTLGQAVGDRNLYEKHDPLNPIFEVEKKSTALLELKYVGKGANASVNSIQGIAPSTFGVIGIETRQPPPGQ